MKEIKNCPFCGGRAALDIHRFGALGDTFGIRCQECQAQTRGFYNDADEAADAWNRRDGEKKLRSNLRDCKNELCLYCGRYTERHNGACDGCRWNGELT